jgi:hypothetical protein
MKSFPSTFSKNDRVSTSMAGSNIKDLLKNAAGQLMNGILGGSAEGETQKHELYEKLTFPQYDYYESIDKTRLNNKFVLVNTTSVTHIGNINGDITTASAAKKIYYENAFKIPAKILDAVNRYKYAFAYTLADVSSETSYAAQKNKQGKEKKDKNGNVIYDESTNTLISERTVSQSIFNPWYGVRVQGMTLTMPLVNNFNPNDNNVAENTYINVSSALAGSKKEEHTEFTIQIPSHAGDVSDCSIQTLVNLSGGYGSYTNTPKNEVGTGLGRAKYRWADFMYCKDLGKVSNNHLITLRKFNAPVDDNIFYYDKKTKETPDTPDKGRLISWFGTDDNKLEDIINFRYEAKWDKKDDLKVMDVDSKEESSKMIPSLINLTNANYITAVQKGLAGESNLILNNWLGDKLFGTGSEGMWEGHKDKADYYWRDANKVYEPKNTVRDTHIYNGKLTFNHEINLTFSYKLRSYDGINPKSAFLDLIGNILEVTYRRGTFFGGSYRWKGAPRNEAGWQKANAIIDTLGEAAIEDMQGLLGLDMENWGNFLSNGSFAGALKDMVADSDSLLGKAAEVVQNIKDNGFEGAMKALDGKGPDAIAKAGRLAIGAIKNKIGRPAIYGLDSIVSGRAVGMWHLTVGNPRNPILAIGNLILTGASIQQLGPLGFDDFPTELKVKVTLTHGKSRDAVDIANMYTIGKGAIYNPIKNLDAFKNMFPRIWNTNASSTIDYTGDQPVAETDEIGTVLSAESAGSTKIGTLTLRPEDMPKYRDNRRPIDETVSVPGNPMPERSHLGFDDDESIKKLQLQYILRNL